MSKTIEVPLWGRASGTKAGRSVAVGYALIDAEDFDLVSQYRWRLMPDGYAVTTTPRHLLEVIGVKTVYMHRLVMDFPESQIDHTNRNPIDNRRKNLRLATHSQNLRNRPTRAKSGFRGVGANKRWWVAAITVGGQRHYLGSFSNPEDAARAYDRAVWSLKPEDRAFAVLNYPDERHLVDLTLRRKFYPQESAHKPLRRAQKAA